MCVCGGGLQSTLQHIFDSLHVGVPLRTRLRLPSRKQHIHKYLYLCGWIRAHFRQKVKEEEEIEEEGQKGHEGKEKDEKEYQR